MLLSTLLQAITIAVCDDIDSLDDFPLDEGHDDGTTNNDNDDSPNSTIAAVEDDTSMDDLNMDEEPSNAST